MPLATNDTKPDDRSEYDEACGDAHRRDAIKASEFFIDDCITQSTPPNCEGPKRKRSTPRHDREWLIRLVHTNSFPCPSSGSNRVIPRQFKESIKAQLLR